MYSKIYRKGVTLIKVMVIILILSIITTVSVINIKDMSRDSYISTDRENVARIQTASDRYFIERNSLFASTTQPTIKKPSAVSFNDIYPNYMHNIPNLSRGMKYWVSTDGKIWASSVDAPTNISKSNNTLTWDKVEGAIKYKIYKIVVSKRSEEDSYKYLDEIDADNPLIYTGAVSSSYLVSAVDKDKFETAPVGEDYVGYGNQPPVAIIDVESSLEIASNIENIQAATRINKFIHTKNKLIWRYISSFDPDGDAIVDAEWENALDKYVTEGEYIVRLRVKDERGLWSEWVEASFDVSPYEKQVEFFSERFDENFPTSISFEEDGYDGFINIDGTYTSTVIGGSLTPPVIETRSTKIGPQRGVLFPDTVNYSQGGFNGTLFKKSTSYVEGNDVDSSSITQTITQNNSNFDETIPYSQDGFNGNLSKKGSYSSRIISGYYSPLDDKLVTSTITSSSDSFSSTISYNSGGYSGSLTKDGSSTSRVVSGSYTSSDSKTATSSSTSSFDSFSYTKSYNSGGYSGTLTKSGSSTQYVSSGSYTPSDSKTVSGIVRTSSAWTEWTYSSGSWVKTDWYSPSTPTLSYNSGGYSGILNKTGWSQTGESNNPPSSPNEGSTYVSYRYYEGYYGGTVTKPAVDTRVYRYRQNYSGTVTKPAVDTRIYEYTQDYAGTVTKPAIDTRVYEYTQTYEGIVSKSIPLYSQDYEGNTTKDAVDTRIFKYRQRYIGTITVKD